MPKRSAPKAWTHSPEDRAALALLDAMLESWERRHAEQVRVRLHNTAPLEHMLSRRWLIVCTCGREYAKTPSWRAIGATESLVITRAGRRELALYRQVRGL